MVLAYFDEVPSGDPSEIGVFRRSTTAAVEFGQVGGSRDRGQKFDGIRFCCCAPDSGDACIGLTAKTSPLD